MQEKNADTAKLRNRSHTPSNIGTDWPPSMLQRQRIAIKFEKNFNAMRS